MALTIVNTIPLFALVKNFIHFLFSTNNRYSTAGAYASIKMNFSGSMPQDAETFSIAYTDADGIAQLFEYAFVDETPASIYEIRSYASQQPLVLNFSDNCPLNDETFEITVYDTTLGGITATYIFKDTPSGVGEIQTKQGDFVDDWLADSVLPFFQADTRINGYVNFEITSADSSGGFIEITTASLDQYLLTGSEAATDLIMASKAYADEYLVNFVLPQFQKNFYMMRDFLAEITASTTSTGTIKLTGHNYNAIDLTLVETVTGFAFADEVVGVVPVERANFKVWIETFIEETFMDGVFTPVQSDQVAFNTSEQADIYLEKLLKQYLTYDLPTYNTSNVAACANMIKRWNIWYSEAYGTPPIAIEYTRYPADFTTHLYAINAGQKKSVFALDTYITEYLTEGNTKFLTNQPRSQYIHPDQPLFLYLYITSNLVWEGKITIYYTDGTSSNHTLYGGSGQQGYITICPVGYAQNSIDALATAGKTVDYYTFWVEYSNAAITEIFTLKPASNYSGKARFYLYQNAWGTFDTLWCSGELIEINKQSRETFSLIGTGSDLIDNVNYNYREYQQDTGYQPDDMMAHLPELLNSANVFLDNGSAYQHISLMNEDDLITQDYDLISNYIIKYRTDTLENV